MRHILLLTLFKQSAAIEFFSVLTATLILFPTFTKYHILTVFVFSFLVSLQIILYHRIVLLLFFLHIYFFFLILMHEVCERAKILFAILFFFIAAFYFRLYVSSFWFQLFVNLFLLALSLARSLNRLSWWKWNEETTKVKLNKSLNYASSWVSFFDCTLLLMLFNCNKDIKSNGNW